MTQHCVPLGRRDFLQVGGISAWGLGLNASFAQSAKGAAPAKAKSCILIWLDGGPSHLESFDPKPNAPNEVRGPFGAMSTSVPGIQLSELLPRTAATMQHSAIIRSMTSPLGEHNFGTHYLLTGYKPTPALNYPAIGSVVSHLASHRGAIPPHVAVPDLQVGGGKFIASGYLPARVAPFEVGGDPSKPDFRVRDLEPFPGIVDERLERRHAYLHALNSIQDKAESISPADPAFEQAYRLMTSSSGKRAFDLSAESQETRRRYGTKSIGQCCLLARRLVEAGVPFVTVNNRGWDTHDDLVTRLKDGYTGAKQPVGLIPSLDRAYSSLITDLHDRGLLDETLVVVMGEFGRTPKLNTLGGRDHWPRVFSVMLAGGGIPGGQVIGASDDMGESPRDRPVTPADLAATIYKLLGIDPATNLQTADGRPVKVSLHGTPLSELVG
ncbi:hypothetical protein Poly51_33830 [Rubripirellula tenax]|uniref:DUF1501 domain-containing protein n=1 Tax=Rubripirellula tenax TaxID=2528015 RepID=A0A5C6F232_9BACT|nr:DUF1501 domain-containing protein [Rubripirellula tenax]TWU54664.1 hypothetical protein Poly51_33830 [Rubripirellula tenax]